MGVWISSSIIYSEDEVSRVEEDNALKPASNREKVKRVIPA